MYTGPGISWVAQEEQEAELALELELELAGEVLHRSPLEWHWGQCSRVG